MLTNLFYELLFAIPFLLIIDLIVALIRTRSTDTYKSKKQKDAADNIISIIILLFKVMHQKKLFVDTLSFRYSVH